MRDLELGIPGSILPSVGLSFLHNSNRTGSGRTPLQILAIYNLFHTVVLECQGALDQIVWSERRTHGTTLARLVHAMRRRCYVTPPTR